MRKRTGLLKISFLVTKIKSSFKPFAAQYLNGFFDLLTKIPVNSDYFELRGRIIEAISIVGFYLDSNELDKFAEQLLKQLYFIIELNELKIDDPLLGYVETLIVRMTPFLQNYLDSFIENYLPFLLKRCCFQIPIKGGSGLSEEKKSAIGCLSILINENFNLLTNYITKIVDIVIDSSRSYNIEISAISINSAASLYIKLYSPNPNDYIALTLERIISVLEHACKSTETLICYAGVGSLERIIQHEVYISPDALFQLISLPIKKIEHLKDISKLVHCVISTISTAIVIGGMKNEAMNYIQPLIQEKLQGTTTERVVGLELLKVMIEEIGIKSNGILFTFNDPCLPTYF